MASGASMFKNIKKILVIKFRHIGDVLLTVPAIRALKQTFPDARVTVLVNSGTEQVLAGNPAIDELMVFDRSIKKLPAVTRYLKEISFLKKIRANGFDMTVDLTGGDRAAVVSFVSGTRYRLAADPGRKGFACKRFLYTHLADIQKTGHMALQNLDVLRCFGINTDNTEVDFFIPQQSSASIKKIFEENGFRGTDPVAHMHPTSRWLWKCWKDEYMAEVISWLIDNGIKVVVTSAPTEKELEKAKKILSFVDPRFTTNGSRLLDLCGKTTIKELAAVSAASSLFIGVDSAPMHIAAAVKTPVIALFGPTDKNSWAPYGKGHVVIEKPFPCKPCKKGSCADIQLRDCMTAIKPDDVKKAVSTILNLKTRDSVPEAK